MVDMVVPVSKESPVIDTVVKEAFHIEIVVRLEGGYIYDASPLLCIRYYLIGSRQD